MKIALSGADLAGVEVDLGTTDVIRVRAAKALRGLVEQSGERLALSNIVAESVELEELRMLLGELVLAAPKGAVLSGLGMSLDQSASQLTLAATLVDIEAQELDITIGDVHVRGRAKLAAPNLVVHGDEGSLASSHVQITEFSLRIGTMELAADALRGVSVKILWGAAGFRLAATSLEAPTLRFVVPDVEVAGAGVNVLGFALDTHQIAIERASLESGSVALRMAPSTSGPSVAAPAPAPAPAAEPVVSLRTLDRLAGQLDVDVAVDVTVPIIGHRAATHRLRVAIDGGTIDYEALEHNLAKLEDALLDFSVRENALCLERVNPLFPTRGHGKPIVFWDLPSAADVELAHKRRVRLSALPNARLASDGSQPPPPPSSAAAAKPSPIALRELGLLRINARLGLAPPTEEVGGQVQLMSVGTLTLGGNIFHDPKGAREGSLLGEAREVAVGLRALALGTSALTASSFVANELAPIEAAFRDVSLEKISVGFAGAALEGVVLTL